MITVKMRKDVRFDPRPGLPIGQAATEPAPCYSRAGRGNNTLAAASKRMLQKQDRNRGGHPMFAFHDLLEFTRRTILAAAAVLFVAAAAALAQTDPLPSWNDTAPKAAIVAFVEKVTQGRLARLRAGARTHRGVRQRRHAMGRASDVRPACLRARPGQGRWPQIIPNGRRHSRSRRCSKAT